MNYRKSHIGKGVEYDRIFIEDYRTFILSEIERKWLSSIVGKYYNHVPISHLDFACGTGRIIEYLQTQDIQSTGIDVSKTMLEVARQKCPHANFLEMDVTEGEFEQLKGKYNLVTSFRFLTNAEPLLRHQALAASSSFLADEGYMVVNNHFNSNSLLLKIVSLKRGVKPLGIEPEVLEDLFDSLGFEVVRRVGIGILPLKKRNWFPKILKVSMDRIIGQLPIFNGLALNHLYVLRRKCT